MARKKNGNNKANQIRSPRISVDIDCKLPDDKRQQCHQPQPSLSPYSSPLEYDSPDNDSSMTTPQIIGRNINKGKGRVNPTRLPLYEITNHDSSSYCPSDPEDPVSHQQQSLRQLGTSSVTQYLPKNQSRDQSRDDRSGGFFEGANHMEIKGGQFNQTYGHHNHTSVTIHVNPHLPTDLHEEDDTAQQHSVPHGQPFVSQSESANHNANVPPPTPEINRSQFPSMEMYGQRPSISRTIYTPDNSNKIYERHLLLKQRGFPFWIPEPNRRLPMCYRRKGISIGDVGIITASGAFSFLFNICLPHDHPINPPTLPDDFAPISIGLRDISEYSEFKSESYLASTAINKVRNDPPSRGLSFETSSAEGAILTLPDGAVAHQLENVRRFREYFVANIENWYRYVNGPCGREVENGKIRLVIGCDKATSWGMVAVANLTQHKTHYLQYHPVVDDGIPTAPIPLYNWEYTGSAEARVGPDLPEIEDLKRNDDSDAAMDGKYWNQCLFIRSLNLKLSDDVFAEISRELDSPPIHNSQQSHNGDGDGHLTDSSSNVGTQTGRTNQHQGMNSTTQRGSTLELSVSATENLTVGNVIREGMTMSKSPSAPKLHPADVLNNYLLQKFPNSRMVITQDEDWCSVISEDDGILPNLYEIAERVLASHHIREEDGVVFLEPKKEHQSTLPCNAIRSTTSHLAENHMDSQMTDSSRLGSGRPSPDLSSAEQLDEELLKNLNFGDISMIERRHTDYYDYSSLSQAHMPILGIRQLFEATDFSSAYSPSTFHLHVPSIPLLSPGQPIDKEKENWLVNAPNIPAYEEVNNLRPLPFYTMTAKTTGSCDIDTQSTSSLTKRPPSSHMLISQLLHPSMHAPQTPPAALDHQRYSFIALPGNTVKKRPRMRYDEIEQLYSCSWPDCSKSYGSLNHLNAHVTMQKHGSKQSPNEFKELRKQWRKAKKQEVATHEERSTFGDAAYRNSYPDLFFSTCDLDPPKQQSYFDKQTVPSSSSFPTYPKPQQRRFVQLDGVGPSLHAERNGSSIPHPLASLAEDAQKTQSDDMAIESSDSLSLPTHPRPELQLQLRYARLQSQLPPPDGVDPSFHVERYRNLDLEHHAPTGMSGRSSWHLNSQVDVAEAAGRG